MSVNPSMTKGGIQRPKRINSKQATKKYLCFEYRILTRQHKNATKGQSVAVWQN